MQQTLGKTIQAARLHTGLSMRRLAEAVGVTHVSVHYWENDVTAPTARHVLALERTLDVGLREQWVAEMLEKAGDDAQVKSAAADRAAPTATKVMQ